MEKAKKVFLLLVLILLLCTTYISIKNFELTEIPTIVSFVGWIIAILFQLSNKLKSQFTILFKGFLVDTVSNITVRVTDIHDFDLFLSSVKDLLHKSSKINVVKFPVNYTSSVKIETKYDNTRTVNFELIYYNYNEDENPFVFIKFEPLQNRHSKVLEFSEVIDKYLRIFEKINLDVNSEIFFDLRVEYPHNNNPVVSELVSNRNTKLIAKGNSYSVSNSSISVNGKIENLVDYTKKTMSGNLDY